jgi:hypothetical protein
MDKADVGTLGRRDHKTTDHKTTDHGKGKAESRKQKAEMDKADLGTQGRRDEGTTDYRPQTTDH